MISFNTNALYREEGQIIRAEKLGEHVCFNDISRGIFAVIENCKLDKYEIHRRYVFNDYRLYDTPEERDLLRSMDRDVMPVTPEESL